MRNILENEIAKERCNAAALGAFNASVGSSPAETLESFIMKEEEGGTFNQIQDLEFDIRRLQNKIDKISSESVTPFGDALAKSFPLGNVGFMGGSGAKTKAREFNKNIEKSKKIVSLENDLSALQSKLKTLKKGKIVRKNGVSVNSYRSLTEIVKGFEVAIKNKKLSNGDVLSGESLSRAKSLLSDYRKQKSAREKMYSSKFKK